MCYPLPGPRCSPHAKARLDNLRERREEKHAQLIDVAKKRTMVRVELMKNPDSKKLKRSYATLTKRGAALMTQEQELIEKIRLAQIEYDGTKQGQKKLNDDLARMKRSGASAESCLKLSRRISKGRSKNFTRKFQLELAQTKAKTGKSLKERRGDFIGFSDRSGNEVVEEDYDLLTAA